MSWSGLQDQSGGSPGVSPHSFSAPLLGLSFAPLSHPLPHCCSSSSASPPSVRNTVLPSSPASAETGIAVGGGQRVRSVCGSSESRASGSGLGKPATCWGCVQLTAGCSRPWGPPAGPWLTDAWRLLGHSQQPQSWALTGPAVLYLLCKGSRSLAFGGRTQHPMS